MKVVVNPKYADLTDFLNHLLDGGYTSGEVYRNKRNIVEETTVGGHRIVIKIFKKPTEANRIIYTFFRPTKAKRSYDYSMRLLEMGFEVPEPVGYIERSKCGIFHTGCFVSIYTDYRPVADFNGTEITTAEELQRRNDFVREFSSFAAGLHERKIVHGDFNKENVLYKITEGKWRFSMIDLNRMSFGNLSRKKAAKDLGNLGFDLTLMADVIKRYSQIKKLDAVSTCVEALGNSKRYNAVKRFKRAVLTPLGLRRK